MKGNWTAVIVNYNGAVFLESSLAALLRCRLQPAEIIVVDNHSDDDSLLELNAFPQVIPLPQPYNRGFAGGANAGLAKVETDFALILNPDVDVDPDFGDEFVKAFQNNLRLGAAGALLLFPDGKTVQHAGGTLEWPLLETRHRAYGDPVTPPILRETPVDFATGAALGVRVEAVRQIGGFDERLTPVYYEDVDLCARLGEAGWEVRYLPQLRATHVEGVTLRRSPEYYRYLHQNRLKYALKHLTPEQWNREFVPAEYARLRHALSEASGLDWPDQTGAGAIELVLRDLEPKSGRYPTPLLNPGLLADTRESIAWAESNADVTFEKSGSRIPLLDRLRNLINRPLRDALARQQEFNQAVVSTLNAQEQVSREQCASLLLFGLLAMHQLESNAGKQSGPERE